MNHMGMLKDSINGFLYEESRLHAYDMNLGSMDPQLMQRFAMSEELLCDLGSGNQSC